MAWACSSGKSVEGPTESRSLFAQLQLSLGHIIGFRGRNAIPIYWENAHKDLREGLTRSSPQYFDDAFPVSVEERRSLELLLNETRSDKGTRFRVVRAVRIENSVQWGRYQKQAARIARKRGGCHFLGRGAPLTADVLDQVAPALADFTQDLDPHLCECYLWHGTRPQVALQIERKGFQVDSHSTVGKRFGAGGYFAEDSSLADKYAGAGAGLYSDCFAMLLSRVLLGQQYVVTEFKDEFATERARGQHDSTLAEPRNASWREFVVFENSQIYPEYALVYERHSSSEVVHDELMHDDLSMSRSASWCSSDEGGELPWYWFHTSSRESFHDMYPAEAVAPVIQALTDCSWVRGYTTHRKGADGLPIQDPLEDLPTGLHVLKVLRVEDSYLWSEYVATQEQIRRSRVCEVLQPVRGVMTVEGLPLPERRRLAEDVNEVYLWHGSSPERVTSIASNGFPAALQSLRPGATRADGLCFVESATHADEYAEDDKDGYYQGYYAMMLCRVTLGKAQVLGASDVHAHKGAGHGHDFDSIVREVECSVGTFREFAVPDRTQIYPEYAIIYERKYRRARVR